MQQPPSVISDIAACIASGALDGPLFARIGAFLGAKGTLALTGPTSGSENLASTNFTVTPASLSGADTVTLATSGTGTFSPASLSFGPGSPAAQTFTYTPTGAPGTTHSISITDSLGATITGSPISYVVAAAPTTTTVSGPTTGAHGSPSAAFTFGLNHPAIVSTVLTPTMTSLAGTWVPATVTVAVGQTSAGATATFNATAGGTGTPTTTNTLSLANGTATAFVAS